MSTRVLAFSVLTSLSLVLAYARAQDGDDVNTAAVVDRRLTCAQSPYADVTETLRLLAEAKTTLESRTATDAERAEARFAYADLELRLEVAARAIEDCADEPAERTIPSTGVATLVVPTPVAAHVGVERAEQLWGAGVLSTDDVEAGVARIGPSLESCYAQLAQRHPGARVSAHLVFTLAGREVLDPAIADVTIDDPGFTECLTRAVGALRVEQGSLNRRRLHGYVPLFFHP